MTADTPPSNLTLSYACLGSLADAEDLRRDLAALLGHQWVDHVNLKDYDGGWDVLPLRCQRQHLGAHPILQGFAIAESGDWENLPLMDLCPTIATLISGMSCPVKSARLMRLKAGARIHPHRDYDLGLDYGEARLHLPLQTNERLEFIVNGDLVPMKIGELWYINTDLVHSVYNGGEQDRINLVIDCEANDWLRQLIGQGNPLGWAA